MSKGISRNAYAEEVGLPTNYFWTKRNAVEEAIKSGSITPEDYNTITDLFKQIEGRGTIKDTTPFPDQDLEDTDDISNVRIIRSDGRITGYSFVIYIRDKQSLIGTLNRDEMNMVYRLYSNYGSNITQREVSRFFPDYSLVDFKRILRAFSITKASAPFAPHVIEENSKDKLLEMQFREKENDFLRTYEAEKIKFTESQLKKYMKENQELKAQINDFSGLLDDIDLSSLPKYQSCPECIEDRNLIIWLSDMHIGASVSGYSIYENDYDQNEVNIRLHKIVDRIRKELINYGSFKNVIVCNLGDSLDGYNGETTRGGHKLPQNMNNKDQLKAFITTMTTFMNTIAQDIPCGNLAYYCVGESNHDGDFGYAANIALQHILAGMNIQAEVFDKFIGEFTLDSVNYVLCHGNLIFINIICLGK